MKFKKYDLKAIQLDTKRYINVNLTLKQIETILAEDKKGLAQWLFDDFTDGPATEKTWKYGLDTMVRDYWFDLISYRFTDQPWPIIGDGPSDAFFKSFYKALAKNNIKFKNIYA